MRNWHRLAHEMREMEHAMADATGRHWRKFSTNTNTRQHEFDLAAVRWHHSLEATLLGIGLDVDMVTKCHTLSAAAFTIGSG